MIGNSGKLPGVAGATDSAMSKLGQPQLGVSPKIGGDTSLKVDGMIPTNLLGGRKIEKSTGEKQMSRKNLAVNG